MTFDELELLLQVLARDIREQESLDIQTTHPEPTPEEIA